MNAPAAKVVVTPRRLLVDTVSLMTQLVEDAARPGKVIIRGEFSRCDRRTENGRVYSRALMEREISKLQSAISRRSLLGSADHPASGRTSLQEGVSHIITSLRVQPDGRVIGEAEIVDTQVGKDLQALYKAGASLGVSSRGYGSTIQREDGNEDVGDDYTLKTYDIVIDPADEDAYPTPHVEDKSRPVRAHQKYEDRERVMAHDGDVRAHVAGDRALAADFVAQAQGGGDPAVLSQKFEAEILSKLGQLSAGARDKIRAEMLSDPQVGGAKDALEQIKTILRPFVFSEDAQGALREAQAEISRLKREAAEKDLKLKEAQTEHAKMFEFARDSSYRWHMERVLRDHPDRDAVVAGMGQLAQYETSDAFKAKLKEVAVAVRESKAKEAAESRALKQRLEQEKALASTESTKLREENAKLQEAVELLLQENAGAAVKLYAVQRAEKHPLRARVLALVEQRKPDSQAAVDKILEECREHKDSYDKNEGVRDRVRRLTGRADSASETSARIEETREAQREARTPDLTGTGISLGDFRALSGI